MLDPKKVRKITAVDETVVQDDAGQNCITVYSFDNYEGKLVRCTKEVIKDYCNLLKAYPSLIRHAKKKQLTIWKL